MARTPITVQHYNSIGGELVTAYESSAAEMKFLNDGRTVLRVKNDHGATATTVTVYSVSCTHGRLADQIVSVEHGDEYAFGPYTTKQWNSSGYVNVDFSFTTLVTVKAEKIN